MEATTARSGTSAGSARLFLYAGAAGGLVFAIASLVQAIIRTGFDPLRHAVSQLALGPGGLVQVVNFVVSGLLMIIGAVGLRQVLREGRGRRAVPILIAIQGLGFVAAGFLPADPGNGYPPGAEATFSMTGILHLSVAGIAFLALIVVCFVLASRVSSAGDRRWAIAGRVSAVLLALGFLFANTGLPGGPLAMFLGALIAWIWFGLTVVRLARDTTGDQLAS